MVTREKFDARKTCSISFTSLFHYLKTDPFLYFSLVYVSLAKKTNHKEETFSSDVSFSWRHYKTELKFFLIIQDCLLFVGEYRGKL